MAAKKSEGGGQRRAAETSYGAGGKATYVAPVVPDPGIRYGAFRVLQRTDGRYVVLEDDRHPDQQVVYMTPERLPRDANPIEMATAEAKRLSEANLTTKEATP